MKLKNTTEWPDYFLRRMVSWCCKQIGLPPSKMKLAVFGNKTESPYGGRGGTYRIYVAIGPASAYPVEPFHYPGRTHDEYLSPRVADRLEGLVAVTAHELTHCLEHQRFNQVPAIRAQRLGWNSEAKTMINERKVHAAFVANREALLAEWNAPPASKPEKPKATAQEKRAAKALADLDRWQRKLKRAQTKVRKLKTRVRYYEQTLAAKRSK